MPGFLLFLEQIQVLNLETREMVIERVLALDTAEFELEDLKWVILMVLFNIPGCENAYQQMEELLFEVNEVCCINLFAATSSCYDQISTVFGA